MTDATDDPIRHMYRRLRLPLGLLFLSWIVIQNLEELTSGRPLPTVAAVAVIAFFAWLFLRPFPSMDVSSADELRERNRREAGWWALWTALAVTVVAWASLVNGFNPRSLLVITLPLLGALGSIVVYAKADAITARTADSRPSHNANVPASVPDAAGAATTATRPRTRYSRSRPWVYLFAAPIVLIMTVALINDPQRLGDESSVSDAPLPFFITILTGMTALMTAVWWWSTFRYRTATALVQVGVVWGGGLLLAFDVRTHVTGWDILESAVLLVTTLLQLIPGQRGNT